MKHEAIVYTIYNRLSEHRGEALAISGKHLANHYLPHLSTESGKREIKAIINTIRNSAEFDCVIASCDAGYYWATEKEQSKALKRVWSQAFECLKTARAQEKKMSLNGQLAFDADNMTIREIEAFVKERAI